MLHKSNENHRTNLLESVKSEFELESVKSSHLDTLLKGAEEILVDVHTCCIMNDLVMGGKIEYVKEKFNPENIYFTPIEPYEMPKNPLGNGLPDPEDAGNVYIIGCYLGVCVNDQIEFLINNNYGNMQIIEDLVI